MSKRINIKNIALSALLAGIVVVSIGAASNSSERPVWEYRIISSSDFSINDAELNNLVATDGNLFLSVWASRNQTGTGNDYACYVFTRVK